MRFKGGLFKSVGFKYFEKNGFPDITFFAFGSLSLSLDWNCGEMPRPERKDF